jgi:subtilisin family serine protease
MAAPVVAGVAAVLRSYYPKLSAAQIKNIIEQSVTKIDGYVTRPGVGAKQVLMSELCKTGGVVNAYQAVKLAEHTHVSKKRR